MDPAASKSLLAVLDGRGARAAVDADTRRELQAEGVGSFDEAAGVFKFFACALCRRDGPEQMEEAHCSGQEAQEEEEGEEEGEEEDDVEDEVLSEDEAVEDDAPGLAQFVMVASAAPLQVPSSPLPACDALATCSRARAPLTRTPSRVTRALSLSLMAVCAL